MLIMTTIICQELINIEVNHYIFSSAEDYNQLLGCLNTRFIPLPLSEGHDIKKNSLGLGQDMCEHILAVPNLVGEKGS